MKLLFMIGNAAVGKMTVGQALMKRTGLRLFHNHMTIEPVIETFGYYDGNIVRRLREIYFEEFAASDNEGMIFTYMWDFDAQSDWDYVTHVRDIFVSRKPDTQVCYVELISTQAKRLERNGTENRLQNKKSKRDVEDSNRRLIADDKRYRCESREGEVQLANYLRIDNTDLSPDEAADIIVKHFGL